jgi:uncharacterized repeat protein (TIGR02543 family)
MNRKRIYAGTAAVLLLFFFACKMMGPETESGPGPDGKAAVHIGIETSGVQGRTVLPVDGLGNVSTWYLWGGKSSESEILLKDFSGITTTVYLETGTWNFTLKGYKSNDLILVGNITGQNITLEGPNTLAFTVAPVLEGSGSLKITVSLPAGHGITGAKVFKDGTQVGGEIAPAADKIVFENNSYPAGDYYFSIRLYKNTDLYGVVSELVQVRGNLRSEKTCSLGLEDLNRTYLVTYHVDGGSLDSGVDNPGYYRSTNAGFTLPVPARTGYNFDGWYGASNFSGGAVTEIPQGSVGDKDFYAKWESYSYIVTFDKNDGTTEANPATKTVASPATSIDALPAPPTRTGYILL